MLSVIKNKDAIPNIIRVKLHQPIRNKTIVILCICFLIILALFIYICFHPIIIHGPNRYPCCSVSISDDRFNPIETFDFTQGDNRIIIYTNWADIRFLPKGMRRWTVLESKDNSVIETVRKNFVFKRISDEIVETTDYDCRIFFLKDGKLVFSCKMEVEESISLYFQNTGWVFAENYDELVSSFSSLKPVPFPVVKIK